MLMINSVLQIKGWVTGNDNACFFGSFSKTQATLKWKLIDNKKVHFKYAFLNFSIFCLQKLKDKLC